MFKATDFYNRFDKEHQPYVFKSKKQGVELLREINTDINTTIRYKPEPIGQDHWQTPEETNKIRSGDCEDFAWYKWYYLLQNGVDEHDMYLMQGMETTAKQYHAVLMVYMEGKLYYLDNETDDITAQTISFVGMYTLNRFGYTFYR